jgi:hypothetical protein
MLRKLEVMIILTESEATTIYLFDRENKMLLPVKVCDWDYFPVWILETLHECERLLGASPILVELDLSGEKAAAAIILSCQNETIRQPVNIQFGIIFAQYFELPIFIDGGTLDTEGIQITEEIIKEALDRN